MSNYTNKNNTKTYAYTINHLLSIATELFDSANLFYGHGTDNSLDEAIYLVLGALNIPYAQYESVLNQVINKKQYLKLMHLIKQRVVQRIPVAYLLKEAWFAGMSFYVDKRVLIPRSPIAELINNRFQPWIGQNKVSNILDMCTGSACIAIACAKIYPHAKIDASDISTDALEVAKINILRHDVKQQVTLYKSDLFTALPKKQYDIIVCNPPYVNRQDMLTLPKEYLHEPQLGLSGGIDGLDLVRKILQYAKYYIKPGGILIIEVGNSEDALIKSLPNTAFIWPEFEQGGGGVCLLMEKDW